MHAVKQNSERTYRWHKHCLLSAVWQFLQPLKGSKRGFKRESINRYPMSISTVCTMVHITLNVFVIKMQFMC